MDKDYIKYIILLIIWSIIGTYIVIQLFIDFELGTNIIYIIINLSFSLFGVFIFSVGPIIGLVFFIVEALKDKNEYKKSNRNKHKSNQNQEWQYTENKEEFYNTFNHKSRPNGESKEEGYNKSDKKQSNEYSHSHGKTTREQDDIEKKYANVLELKGNVSPKDIKIAYRNLILLYHPDKFNHLGQEFRIVAEMKTKEINEAYRYFKDKYNIV